MFVFREWVDAGGLVSYGASLTGLFGRAAEYVDKLAKGAAPSDLPIEQPTKFELILNLKTAKKTGLPIPEATLLRADEVIFRNARSANGGCPGSADEVIEGEKAKESYKPEVPGETAREVWR